MVTSPAAPSRTVLDDVVGRFALAPAPRGDGRTLHNWRVLAQTAAADLDVARLAEAHLDAATIVAELGAPGPAAGELWGVWAAGSPDHVLRADRDASGAWRLSGTKPWCSGADRAVHALVTVDTDGGARLFDVDLGDESVGPDGGAWQGVGMCGSGTATVRFRATPARPVGGPGAYLDRPGFWHGAIGVAAAWFGGAVGAGAPLRRRLVEGRADAHDAAHRGTVDAALAAAGALLREAAAAVDGAAAGTEPVPVARRRALRARAAVETAVETVLRATGRATGPAPLAHDAAHARHVADLEVYVRQSHAERDLAVLGGLAAGIDGGGDTGEQL